MPDSRVAQILARRPWLVRPEPFALVAVPVADYARAIELLAQAQAPFAQLIAEPDLITIVLPAERWQNAAAAFPLAEAEAPLRVITFDLDLPADLVGFLAAVSQALADVGVSILALCGYYKDHIMVREPHLAAALAALERLAASSMLNPPALT